VQPDTATAFSLLTPAAVRERAEAILEAGIDGRLDHFSVHLDRLGEAADFTAAITRETYPSLDIPFHSRWRHFVINGEDRWMAVVQAHPSSASSPVFWPSVAARARAEFDLAIVSVLLDAGAGPAWRYHDPASGQLIGRSEGLALASLAMFCGGLFSATPGDPLRADAARLEELTSAALAGGFAAGPGNPMTGLEGRAELLRRLGAAVFARPSVFAREDNPRPGGLFDHLAAMAPDGRIKAATILTEVLMHLGPIWPARMALGGIPLGDCWHHPAIRTADATDGLAPFHKLSQWLTYSLIEPMERAGIAVIDIDGLTGLAEYRNGGLFLDTRVIALRDEADGRRQHEVSSTLVVEWRALTVALLDRTAGLVRDRLGCDSGQLPLPRILQGGTWAAGRAIARKLRADGSPPLQVISDGTVF
jgi:Protein of unknown function (DUF1688)